MSRGERNNNPGNLEASPWTRSQAGYIGTDGRFAIFDTMVNGIAAQAKLLNERYIKKGFDTVSKIIWRYGNDPTPNDDPNVRNYVKYVSNRLGVSPNHTLSENDTNRLAQAMREFETGKTSKGVLQSKPQINNGIFNPIDIFGSWGIGLGDFTGNPITGEAADFSFNPLGIFTAELSGRIVAVVAGVILIGLAIAAFMFLSDNKSQIVTAITKA